MHQVERFVDPLQRQGVGYVRIEVEFTRHRLLHHARQLRAALDAAESSAEPLAAGDELERTRGNLLPRAGDADDHRLAPAVVRAFERGAHHLDVADALERVVHAPAGHLNDRSEEHTSELQSLMRRSYAVFCLKKKNTPNT